MIVHMLIYDMAARHQTAACGKDTKTMEEAEKKYLCSCTVLHEDAIREVRAQAADDETIYYMAEFFRMFCDATRLKIINALMISELCVCDLSAFVGMNQSVVSHHLKILRGARVIKFRRAGKVVYYSLCDEHIRLIFNQGFTHIGESAAHGAQDTQA